MNILTGVKTRNLPPNAVCCVRRVYLPPQFFNPAVAPITLMAISDEAEIPGKAPLEPSIRDTLGALFIF